MTRNPKMTEMTLLDYFAAEALVGLVGRIRPSELRDQAALAVATEAYDIAEQMLVARMAHQSLHEDKAPEEPTARSRS